jgi:hypothetical protein
LRTPGVCRFGSNLPKPPIPGFFIHAIGCKVFEQDMGLLSSQNELLVKSNRGVKDLYLPLKSSDAWVTEYRKWLDKVRTLIHPFCRSSNE